MDKIKVSNIKRTCTACPSAWEQGEEGDDDFLYIRYRHGRLAIAHQDLFNCILEKYVGDPLDGYMTFEEMKEHTAEVLDFSEAQVDNYEWEYDEEAKERVHAWVESLKEKRTQKEENNG